MNKWFVFYNPRSNQLEFAFGRKQDFKNGIIRKGYLAFVGEY